MPHIVGTVDANLALLMPDKDNQHYETDIDFVAHFAVFNPLIYYYTRTKYVTFSCPAHHGNYLFESIR
jgi:hypothetical protein